MVCKWFMLFPKGWGKANTVILANCFETPLALGWLHIPSTCLPWQIAMIWTWCTDWGRDPSVPKKIQCSYSRRRGEENRKESVEWEESRERRQKEEHHYCMCVQRIIRRAYLCNVFCCPVWGMPPMSPGPHIERIVLPGASQTRSLSLLNMHRMLLRQKQPHLVYIIQLYFFSTTKKIIHPK